MDYYDLTWNKTFENLVMGYKGPGNGIGNKNYCTLWYYSDFLLAEDAGGRLI